jgi:hypothetical protein
MRKRGLVVSVFFFAAVLLPSGAPAAGRLKLLGGPAWGKYASDWGMTNVSKPGYFFGAGFEGGSGRLACEVDALYFLKTNSYASRGWDYEMGEISVPVLAKIKLWARSTPFLLVGGELAYILSHKQKPGPLGDDTVYDMMFTTKRWDYGLVFGAGYDLETGPVTLELSGRYHYGLAKVFGLGGEGYDLQTRELAVALGVLF